MMGRRQALAVDVGKKIDQRLLGNLSKGESADGLIE